MSNSMRVVIVGGVAAGPKVASKVIRLMPDAEVTIVDARPRRSYAAGHIEGSLGVELRDDFGTWVGWLLPFDAPLVLVMEPGQDLGEASAQLARIGYEDVRGVVRGLDRWVEAGRPLHRHRAVEVAEFARAYREGVQVLDVRSPAEWEAGHLERSVHRYVPDLRDGLPPGIDPGRDVWIACGSGYRSAFAAALVERLGAEPVILIEGGVDEVRKELGALVS